MAELCVAFLAKFWCWILVFLVFAGVLSFVIVRDMMSKRRLLEELRLENQRKTLILDKIDEIFYEINVKTMRITTSPSFQQRLGWRFPDYVDRDIYQAIKDYWLIRPQDCEVYWQSTKQLISEKIPVSCTVQMKTRTHEYIWCDIMQYPILGKNNELISVVGLIKNINDIVIERERLKDQAQRDHLTGMYNKEKFKSVVKDILKKESSEGVHALLFIDLDHFKVLNDTYGHVMGDRAIRETAEKIKMIFYPVDIVARFGGDEFCIFMENVPMDALKKKLNWMHEALEGDYIGDKGIVHVTCSCGVADTSEVGYDYETLLQAADQALYQAKEAGRNQYAFYHKTDI